jgi:phosphate uptake regulator
MFEKFKELFSSHNLLEGAYETTLTMLEFDSKMYEASQHSLRESDTADLPFNIKEMDRKVNKFEREVRRNVLTHLTVAGTTNLVPGLVLVSVVVDVERIGDYTKNIVELAQNHPERLQGGYYEDVLSEIEKYVQNHFKLTYEVLKNQDKENGRSVMDAEEEIGKKSDSILHSLLKDPDNSMSRRDSIALALYARYLKRINAHLTNVASAIVNPFPRIGFREKKNK